MMTDYMITAVHYGEKRQQITRVRVQVTGLDNRYTHEKQQVIHNINVQGKTYMTAMHANVHTVKGKYIRIDGNGTEADDLGDLPEF